MAARRLVLSGAILGLVWSVYAETTNRCESAPCNCDEFGRLTCDCKGSGEVKIIINILISRLISWNINFFDNRKRNALTVCMVSCFVIKKGLLVILIITKRNIKEFL